MDTKKTDRSGALLALLVAIMASFGMWKKSTDSPAATSTPPPINKHSYSFYEDRCKHAVEPMLPRPALDWSVGIHEDTTTGMRVVIGADVGNEWHGFTCYVSDSGAIQSLTKNSD